MRADRSDAMPNDRPCRALHVITGLNHGGAENMLVKLIEHASAARSGAPLDQAVASLMTPGVAARRLEAIAAPLVGLGMRPGAPSLSAFSGLRRLIKRVRPDIVMGWMHHGFFAATLACRTLRDAPPVVWNVRHSLADIRHEKPMTQAILGLCKRLSGRPAAIVYNSRVARAQYKGYGFCDERARVVPNGFPVDALKPDPAARARLAAVFGLKDDAPTVAMIARQHPMKDLRNFLLAIEKTRAEGRDPHLILVGQGMEDLPSDMQALLERAAPAGRRRQSGHRTDVADRLAGVDVLALPSAWGEGFPNVVGEAMACGVPAVVTDVGDSAWIVGDAGRAVPPGDPDALAAALSSVLDLDPAARRALGLAGRARIVEAFSMDAVAAQYDALYAEVVAGGRRLAA
ncbi:MAG: glycosyltransferase [Parvularculaceae bacterium]